MRLRMFSTAAFLVVLFAVSACSPTQATAVPQQATIEISSDEFNQDPHMTKQVEIAHGGTLNVFLASNPSTGHRWTADAQIDDRAIVEQMGHGYIEPLPDGATPPLVGAPIKETWAFKALKQGTTTVSMRYARPWQSDMGLWSLRLTVTVKPTAG